MGDWWEDPEVVLIGEGPHERWLFWPDRPAQRCQWPTVRAVELREQEGMLPTDCGCYRALAGHPAGVAAMVKRLRAVRRAERNRASVPKQCTKPAASPMGDGWVLVSVSPCGNYKTWRSCG